MSFSKVIEDKIEALENERKVLEAEILSPRFHVERMKSLIEDVIPQISSLDLSADNLKVEFESVLRQIPTVLGEGWLSHTRMVKDIDDTIAKHKEMKLMYLGWEQEQEQKAARDKELKEKISSGQISEPSSKTSRKRGFGERPPITLGRYRKLSEPDDGEDQ